MPWFLTLIILTFTFNNPSQAHKHEKKLQSAVVVGTVYCDTCFHQDFSKTSHFISGALVEVKCGNTNSRPNFRKEVKTNGHGEFKVHLPFSVSKHVKKIKECSVKIVSSSEPYCAVASTATSSSLHLKSRKPGTHIFSAGFFTFKPLKQPALCSQKPSTLNSKKPFLDDPSFPPPLEDPPMSFLPPLPQLPNLPPLPQLPNLPPLPGFPFPSKSSQLKNQKTFGIPFPPNPFQPPSILPPNPFQPPPSILPPFFPSPPPSIIPPILPPLVPIPTVPIPGLMPPPSPPPPSFPFLPPLPPGFPGVPPHAASSEIISP